MTEEVGEDRVQQIAETRQGSEKNDVTFSIAAKTKVQDSVVLLAADPW